MELLEIEVAALTGKITSEQQAAELLTHSREQIYGPIEVMEAFWLAHYGKTEVEIRAALAKVRLPAVA